MLQKEKMRKTNISMVLQRKLLLHHHLHSPCNNDVKLDSVVTDVEGRGKVDTFGKNVAISNGIIED
eukprot:10252966-Ditylum_brightwellii.AAC.1